MITFDYWLINVTCFLPVLSYFLTKEFFEKKTDTTVTSYTSRPYTTRDDNAGHMMPNGLTWDNDNQMLLQKLLMIITTMTPRNIHFIPINLQDLTSMFNDYYVFKSLAPGRCGNDVKSLMFKLIIQNNNLDPGTHREITFRWIPRNLIDQKSTLD